MRDEQLLHYKLGKKLGQGGMGEVYLARDTKLDRDVAVKLLPQSLKTSPEARVRLIREAQAASRLTHPNIVAIYAVEQVDDHDFIVMEYVDGLPLSDMIEGGLNIEQALDIAAQVGDALAVAHDSGVVHRDIKPSNILVTSRGNAKVLDFGLATFYGATQVTDAGTTMGTASYMSPEQTEGRPMDHRSDIFSFGVVLYEMIAGRRPFDGETRNSVAYAIINHQQEPLARFKHGVAPALEQLVAKALRKDPTERYQSVADLLADLKVARRESSGASTVQPGTPPPGYAHPAYQHPQTPPTSHPSYAGAPHPGQMQPGQPYTPSQGYSPAGPTPSQPSPAYGTEPPKGKNDMVKIITIIMGGLIAITAIVAPRIGRNGGDQAEPIRAVATPSTPTPSLQDDRVRIAVLPFDNLGAKDEDYFAEGITDEVTARLASVGELAVIGRASVASYRGSSKAPGEIGKELGVDYILDGSVRWQNRGDQRVKVTPELVRVSDGTTVWSDVYDQPVTAVFQLQSSISKTVVSELGVVLSSSDSRDLDIAPTANVEAYDAYLRGMQLLGNFSAFEEMRVAEAQFQKAVDIDPEFLLGWVRLSVANSDLVWFKIDQSQARVDKARRAAERAMTLAPESADALYSMGWYYYHGQRDYAKALEYLEPAVAKRPGDAEFLSGIAYVQRRQGKMEEALANLERSAELNPRDATICTSMGETLLFLRQVPRSRPWLDKAMELRPERALARLIKIVGYWMEGDAAAGVAEARNLTSLFGYDEFGSYEAKALYLARDYAASAEVARRSGAIAFNAAYYPAPYFVGLAEKAMGNSGKAREGFEAARDHLLNRVAAEPDDFRYHGTLGMVYAELGAEREARAAAEKAMELLPPAKDIMRSFQRRDEYAVTMMLLGDLDAAIDQYEILMSLPTQMTTEYLRKNPIYDPLREHPRFQALLASS